jgi:hypothetical protein
MEMKDYQEGSYDAEKTARAWGLANKASVAVDAGRIEEARELCRLGLELKPALRIETSILLELADALSEWFKPVVSGQKLPSEIVLEKLAWIETILARLRELLKVPDPFDIALQKGWHKDNDRLEFDQSTYLREDEKQQFVQFIDWFQSLCQDLRKAFPHT